jgi:hypothetical protein
VRLLLLVDMESGAVHTSYLAMRATYHPPSALRECWADPRMMRGVVTPEDAAQFLHAWSQDDGGTLGGVTLVKPEFGDVTANPLGSASLAKVSRLNSEAFGMPTEWHFRFWHVNGFAMTSHNAPALVPAQAMSAPADWAGASIGEVFSEHLGKDLSNFSNEQLDVVSTVTVRGARVRG